jgi:hypothetical protein
MENKKVMNDDILNNINTKFIFEFSKKCYDQLKIMEVMLKEENLKEDTI